MTQKKSKRTSPHSIEEFYDLLAPSYDAMTGFEKRFAQEEPHFHALVERYQIKRALDAGCGSGFHSLLLTQLGVQVTAVDVSSSMLALARRHARTHGIRLRTLKSTFDGLRSSVSDRYDAVFVMGNSLAHLLTVEALKKALDNFAALLEPHGILISQLLNYERILASRDRIVSSKESGGREYTRYYEYDQEGIIFNIRTRRIGTSESKGELQTIRLRPVLRPELMQLLSDSGFEDVKLYGSVALEPFDAGVSKDLVIIASRRY